MSVLLTWLLIFSVTHGGKVWVDRADAIPLSRSECARHAGVYGSGVSAGCYRARRGV